jgi:hypothetical protein
VNYQAGVAYQFTVDLLPNFALYHEQQQKYCLTTKSFTQGGNKERFEREVQNEARLRYRLSISGTDYDGRQTFLTEKAYAPGVWYAWLLKEGASECQ